MGLFELSVFAVVKLEFSFGEFACSDDADIFSVGPETEEEVSVGDGTAESVVTGLPVGAIVVGEKTNGERIFKRLLNFARFDLKQKKMNV